MARVATTLERTGDTHAVLWGARYGDDLYAAAAECPRASWLVELLVALGRAWTWS